MGAADYELHSGGFYRNIVDKTGPYVQSAPGVFALAGGGSGSAGPIGAAAAAACAAVTLPNNLTVVGASANAANTDLLGGAVSGWFDAALFRSFAIQLIGAVGITAGAVTFEQTNDSALAAAGSALPVNEPAVVGSIQVIGAIAIAASTARIFAGPILARYIRVRISTAFTGANVQAVGVFSELPYANTSIQALSPTAANFNVTASLPNGQTAHSSASTGSPVRVGGRVNTAVDTTLAAGDASDLFITSGGAVIDKPFSAPELDWQFAAPSGGVITTADVALKAAGAAGVRNYLTGLSLSNASATATEVVVKDGAAVIWRGQVPANAPNFSVVFQTPLRGTAATALNFACITTAAAVYVNAQGYQAP